MGRPRRPGGAWSVDLKRLEYFLSVAEHGSFSRAASVIGVAQPALGRQVQRLEEACGTKLFYRHGRGVSLTREGEVYAQRIRPLLQQLSAAAADLAAGTTPRSEEHTSELQSLMRISYAVFSLKKK